jgi:DnaJ-class molecular chaperone
MQNKTDYYNVLGIDKLANEEDIKKAYRKKSMITHPDRNLDDPDANSKFQKVSEAYDILSDKQKRRMYDMGIDTNGGVINEEELFNFFTNSIFTGGLGGLGGVGGATAAGPLGDGHYGGRAHVFHMGGIPVNFSAGMQKTQAIIKHIEITLDKSYAGCTIPLEITRWIHGVVKQEEKETIYVTIQPGVDDNEIIILREKGNILNEKNKGDVKVIVKIINNTEFDRNGLDLIYNKSISLKEALCGFAFDMKFINGRVFKINNEIGNVISPNYKKIVPKLGMKRENHIGNLIIVFTVVFPDKISEDKINKLKEVL